MPTERRALHVVISTGPGDGAVATQLVPTLPLNPPIAEPRPHRGSTTARAGAAVLVAIEWDWSRTSVSQELPA